MENRYDKYKDSGIAWIGEIPEHWDITNIKNHYNVILGKMVERNNDSSTGGENYLCAANIKWNGVDTGINKKMYFSDIEKEKYLLLYNDVLIMEGGMAGTTCIYKNEFSPCYVQNSVNVCRAKKSFNNKFLYYWMYVPYYNGYIDTICNKATIKHYTKEKVQNTPIPAPSILEQQSIATYLDQKCSEIDKLITLQEEMITKLQSYKQSVITEAVTKGLDKNVPLKDSGIEWIGKIPEHWSKNKIIRLFSIIGSGTTPKSSKEDNYIGSVNWIQSGDINGSYIENCKNSISNTALKEYPTLKIYKAPFIIVAMYGASVGNISISNIDGCVNQACCVMNETKQNFKYLFYAMNSVKKYLIYKAEGGGQPNISQDKIKNTWLPIPPLSEQQSIADYLDQKCSEIDELISIKQQKIEKLKDYKKSLIFECVTGKRKVS